MEGVRWRSSIPPLGVLMLWYCTSAMAAPLAWDDSQPTGCFHMMRHYGEGDQILTNEPCLNCTCTNNMLMCFLKVCPYVKPVNKGCSLEKRPGDCCPTVTCQQVPVPIMQMLGMMNASVSTTSSPRPVQLEESSADLSQGGPGCEVDGQYFRDGAQVPNDPSEPCDVCYCIRNHTACVQQECTMHVPGCRPIFQTGVCCPVRYVCDYETTTLAPTTTTVRPEVAATGCVSNGINYDDGDAIPSEDPCKHCYCMHSEVKCAVQSCASLLDNVHPNCKPEPPRAGQCCPDQYNCDGNGTLESSVGHTELAGPAAVVDMLEESAPGAEALVGTTQASTDEQSQGTPQSGSSRPEISHVSNIDGATVSSSQVDGGESVGHSSISSESTSTQDVTEDINADTEDSLAQESTTGSEGMQVEVSTTSGEQGSIHSATESSDLDGVTDGSYESSGDDVSEDGELEFSGSVETESLEADGDEQVLIEDVSDTDAGNDETTDEETSGDSNLLPNNDEYVVEESSGEAVDENNEGLAVGAESAENIDEASGDDVEEAIDSQSDDGAAGEESVVVVSGEAAPGGDDTFPVTDSDVIEIEPSENDEVDASGDEPTIAITPTEISSTEPTADEVEQVSPVIDEIAVVATIDSTQDPLDTLEEEIEGEGSGDNVDEVSSFDPTVEEVTTETTQTTVDIINERPGEIEGSGDSSVNGISSVDPTVDELVSVETTSSTQDMSDTLGDGLEGSGDANDINEVAPVDIPVDEVDPVDSSVDEVAPVDISVDEVATIDSSADGVATVDPTVDEVAASVTTESTQDSIEILGGDSIEVEASGDDALITDILGDGLSPSESSGDVLPAEDTADIEVPQVETSDAITVVDNIITLEQTNSDGDSMLEFSGDEELENVSDGENVQVGDGSGENAPLVDVQTVDVTSMETSEDNVVIELAATVPDEESLDENESSGEDSIEVANPSDGAVSTIEIPVESLESDAHSLEDSQVSPGEGSGEEFNVGELDSITDNDAIEIDIESSGTDVEATPGGSEELDEVVVAVPLEDETASANPEGESIENVESSGHVMEHEITDINMMENDISVTEGSGQPETATTEDTIEQSGDIGDTAEDTSSLTGGMIDSTGELPVAVDVPTEIMTNTESQNQNELSPDDASTSSPTSEEVEDIYEADGISDEATDSEMEGSGGVSTGVYTDSDHLSSDMETSGDVSMLNENEEHADEGQKPLIIDLPTNEEGSGQEDQENEQIEMSGEEPVLEGIDGNINQVETNVEVSGDMIEQDSDQILIESISQSETDAPLQSTTGVVVEGNFEEASGEIASDTFSTLGNEEDDILPEIIIEDIVEASGDLVATEQESDDIIDSVVESSGDSAIPDYADSISNIGEASTETSGDEIELDAVEDTAAVDTDSILEFSGDIIEVNQIDEVLSEDDSNSIFETSGDGATVHDLDINVAVTQPGESTVEDGVAAESSGDSSVESIVIDQIEDDELEGSAGIFETSETEDEIALEESSGSSEEYQPSEELSALGSSTQTQPIDDAEDDSVEMTGTLSEPDGVNGAMADGTDDVTIESSGDDASDMGTTTSTTEDNEIYQTEASGNVVVLDGFEEVEGTSDTIDGLVAIDIGQEALEDADLLQIAEGSGSTAAGEPTDDAIDSEVESSGEMPVVDADDQISFIDTDNDDAESSGGLSAGEESSGDASMAGENNESVSIDGETSVQVESSGYIPGTEEAAGEQFSTVTDTNELETDSLVSTHEEPTTGDTTFQTDSAPVTGEGVEDDVETSGSVPEEINLAGVDNIEAETAGETSDVSSAAEIITEASVPETDVGQTVTDDAASSDESSADESEGSIESSGDFSDADSNEMFTTEGHISSAESSGIAIEDIDSLISQQENGAGEIESSGDMPIVGETVGLGEPTDIPPEDIVVDNDDNADLSSIEGGLLIDSVETDTMLSPDEETDVQEDGESSGDPVQSDGSGSDNFIDMMNSVENETVLEASGDGFSDETTESGSNSTPNEESDLDIPAESGSISVNVDEVTSDEIPGTVEGNIQIPDSSGFESDTTVNSIEPDGQLTGSLDELNSDGSGAYEPETGGGESGVTIEDVHEGSAAFIDQSIEVSIIDGSGYDEGDNENNLDSTHISVVEIDSSVEDSTLVETDAVESSGMESGVPDTDSELSGDIAEDSFTGENQVLSESDTADAASNEADTLEVDVISFEDGNTETSVSSGNLPDYNIEASGDEELISEDGSGTPVEMAEIEGSTDTLSEEADVTTQSPDETTTSVLVPGESLSQVGQNSDAEGDKGKEDGGDDTSSGTLQTIVEVLNGVLGGPSTAEPQQSNSEQNEIATPDSTSSLASNVSSESVTTLEGACTVEGVPYANGSEVPKSDKCQVGCFCSNSVVQCETMHCSGPPADNCRPFYPTDSCCPAYDCKAPNEVSTDSMGCTVGHYKYENGDVVNHHDPCSYCLCIAGEVVCASQVCQTPPQLIGLPCSPLPTKSYECCPTSYACETNDATLAAQSVIQNDATQNITIVITPNEKPSGIDLSTTEEDKADEEHQTDGATAGGPALAVDSHTMTEQQTPAPTSSENTETSGTIAVDVSAETGDTESTSSEQGSISTGEEQQEQSLSQSQDINGVSSNGETDSTIIVQGTTFGEGETNTNTESLEQGQATQTETASHQTSTSSSGIEYLPGHTVTETTVITTEQELQPNPDGSGLGNVVTINYITYIIEDTDADGETSIVSSESRTSSSQRPATMPDIVIFQTPQLPKSKVVVVTTVIDSEGNRQVSSSSDNVVPTHISPLVSTSGLATSAVTDSPSSTNTDEAATASVDTSVDAAGSDTSNDQVSDTTTASEGAASSTASPTMEDEQDLYLPGNSVTETTITSVKESLKPSQDSSDLGAIETYTVITTITEVIDSTGAKRIIKKKTATNNERPAQPSDIYTFSEQKPAEVTSLILITVIDDQGKRTSASSTIFGVPSSLTGLVSADGTLLDETEQPTGSSGGSEQTITTDQQTSGDTSSVETGITSGQSQQTVEVSSGNEQTSSVQSTIISPGGTVTETTITTVEETLQPGSAAGDYGTIFSTTTTTVITEVQNAAGTKDTTAKTTISKAERTAQSWEVPIYAEGSTTSTVTTVVTTQMNENGEETVITSTPDNIPASLAHLHPPTATGSSGKPSSAVYLPGSTITKTTYTTIKRTLEPGTKPGDLGLILTTTNVTLVTEETDPSGKTKTTTKTTIAKGRRLATASDIPDYQVPPAASTTVKKVVYVILENGQVSSTTTVDGVPLESASQEAGHTTVDDVLLENVSQDAETATVQDIALENVSQGADIATTEVSVTESAESSSSVTSQQIVYQPGQTVTETTTTLVEQTLLASGTADNNGLLVTTTTITKEITVTDINGGNRTVTTTTVTKSTRPASMTDLLAGAGSPTTSVTSVITVLNDDGTNSTSVFQNGVQQVDAESDMISVTDDVLEMLNTVDPEDFANTTDITDEEVSEQQQQVIATTEEPATTSSADGDNSSGSNSSSTTTTTTTTQVFLGPGACLFDGKVYVSAQQIPRDNPCDFCFCFRGDIICLQQSCPPPKLGCVNETIEGFCCPRYECPVQPELNQLLAAAPEPAPTSVAQPAAIAGCEIQGVFYRRGQLVEAASGPCLECRCGVDGMMACDPKNCQPQPLLKKMMIAAAQKRRR